MRRIISSGSRNNKEFIPHSLNQNLVMVPPSLALMLVEHGICHLGCAPGCAIREPPDLATIPRALADDAQFHHFLVGGLQDLTLGLEPGLQLAGGDERLAVAGRERERESGWEGENGCCL
jgi:hypothetical protein